MCTTLQLSFLAAWGVATVLMLMVVFRSLWSRDFSDSVKDTLSSLWDGMWTRKPKP